MHTAKLLTIYLTNRFHVAVCKNKKVADEAIGECVTDVLTTFCDLLLNRCTVTWNLFVLYNNKTKYNI